MSEPPVALVTGAARRVGAGIVAKLHAEGYRVIIHYHESVDAAHALADRLSKIRKDSVWVLQADLSEFQELKVLILKAQRHWKRLDVLVHNASRFYPTHIEVVNQMPWQDLMNSNVRAPYFLSCFAYSFLKACRGCIVSISDALVAYPLKDYSIYAISKMGLNMMTRSLALEFAPDVRVNAVAPGIILWPEGKSSVSERNKKQIVSDRPIRSDASVESIKAVSEAVLFLISNQQMTGEVIAVDGGQSLRGRDRECV